MNDEELIWEAYEKNKSISFKKISSNTYIGYRVARYEEGFAVSGADSRQRHSLKPNTVVRFNGKGIFLSNNPKYVVDHYGNHDTNVLIKMAFNINDVTSGSMSDREPEISVSKVTILDSEVYNEEQEPNYNL